MTDGEQVHMEIFLTAKVKEIKFKEFPILTLTLHVRFISPMGTRVSIKTKQS